MWPGGPTSKQRAGGRIAVSMPGHIQTVQRAAAILDVMCAKPSVGLTELADELGLCKTTVYGLVRTLCSVGFVERDDETRRYRLGAALLHMGSSYLHGNELRTRALGWADRLAVRTGQSVGVGTAHDAQVLIVHHVTRSDDGWQQFRIGSLVPAHATAMGKILLAHHSRMREHLRCRDLPAYTDTTIVDQTQLDRELGEIRRQGWSVERGELISGHVSIAVPISDRINPAVGSLALCGSPRSLLHADGPRENFLAYLRGAACALSRELGAPST